MDVYAAQITSATTAGGLRAQEGSDGGWNTFEEAQQWAEHRSATPSTIPASNGTPNDDTIVGRAAWNSEPNAVTWQAEDPYDWSDRSRR